MRHFLVLAAITFSLFLVGCSHTLTYIAGANGEIAGPSPQTVKYGASGAAVTVVPNAGYHFVSWSDGSTENQRTDANVTANIVVTATFAINQYTLLFTAGPNGTIAGTSPQTVDYATDGTAVTAVPDAGYVFVSWSDNSAQNPRTETDVMANVTAIANFAIDTTAVLTINVSGPGSVLRSPAGTQFTLGTYVTLQAVPDNNAAFKEWTGDATGATNPIQVIMDRDRTVTATFYAVDQYTLTYTAGANGLITGASPQTVNTGTSGTVVTAVPNTGYQFVSWSDASTQNPRTDTNVTANLSVTATFAINQYTLAYTAGTNGTITGVSPQTVNYGASGTAVTPTPNTGYHFVSWSDNSPQNPRTDANVTANVTVTASFAINQYTLAYTAGVNGSISGITPQAVTYGNAGTAVTAVSAAHYHFVQWSDGILTAARTDTNVTANVSVAATFAINQYTLAYTAGANGTIVGASPQTVNALASGTAVTAAPNANFHFVAWSDASTQNPRTDANVVADVTVTANFAINQYALAITVSPSGAGTVSTDKPGPSYDLGTVVTLTAKPNVGYKFSAWTGTDNDAITLTLNTVTMSAAKTVTAAFVAMPNVTVPTLVGTSQTSATAVITGAGFVLGTITQQYNATVKAGFVISQTPAANASVAYGSTVTLTVSLGLASVPNVVGMTQSDATAAITAVQLAVGVSYQYSATVAAGLVISQQPAPGTSEPPGTTVDFVISLGPPQLGDTETITLPGSATLELAWIPGGTFTMGSPDAEQDRGSDEGPQSQVTVSGFWLSKDLVTQAQWVSVMGSNPSNFAGDTSRPVETVSWNDISNSGGFLDQVNASLTGEGVYRLPTEAEWEYACRADTTTRFYWGDDPGYTLIATSAWYTGNSGNTTHPVGLWAQNPWGVYDMGGNVWEWCQDWYGPYAGGTATDPAGPPTGTYRVYRGGSWNDPGANCRSAARASSLPANTASTVGFRLARS